MTNNFKTQVLIRFSSLGDLVLCTALVQRLQKSSPLPVHFVTQDIFAPFVEASFPQPLKVIGQKTKGYFNMFMGGFALAKNLRQGGSTDIEVFDLHGVLKSSIFIFGIRFYALTKKLKIKVLRSKKYSLLRNLSVILKKDLLGKRFVYQSHLKLAPNKVADNEADKVADAVANFEHPLLQTLDVIRNTKRILIATDAKHWKKRWILSHWQVFFAQLLNLPQGYEITLVGHQDSLPMDVLDELTDKFPSRVNNLLGKTSLTELATIAASHSLTVCGNSAWLHISEAVGTPVVSLAGPIVPGFGFSPWMNQSTELSVSLRCRPCTLHGGGSCYRIGNNFHACMKFITPDQVLSSVQSKMGNGR